MSLINIRIDGTPLTIPVIHQDKKRLNHHVYKRQNDESEPKFADIPQVDSPRKTKRAVSQQHRLGFKPEVHVSKPGDELERKPQNASSSRKAATGWEDGAESGTTSAGSQPGATTTIAPPRRFHLTRTLTPDSPRSAAGITKKALKGPIPMFLERTKEGSKKHRRRSTATRPLSDAQISQIQAMSRPAAENRKLKRPGNASRVPSSALRRSATPEAANPPAAPGSEEDIKFPTVNQWNAGSDELAAQMHAFTMQEIGRNLAETQAPPAVKSPSRFKPKLPAQRYQERFSSDGFGRDSSGGDADEEMDVDSDEEYVIDTYIRMPGNEVMEGTANFGLLVLDEQMDIAEFYGEEESDSDQYDEDEDENGTSSFQ